MIYKRNPVTGYFGVSRRIRDGGRLTRYFSRIRHPDSSKILPVKYFKTAEEAALFFDKTVTSLKMSEYHPKYPLNFPAK